MAEDTGQVEQQGAPEGNAEGGSAPDLSALDQRIGEMTGKLDDLSTRFDQSQQGPEQGEVVDPGWNDPYAQQQYQQDPYAGQFDPNQQQYVDPNQQYQDPYAYDPQAQMDPQAAQAQIQQMVQQAAAQQVAPIQQQLSEMQAMSRAAELEQEFPDLQKQEVVEQLMPSVEQLAETLGHPELAGDPALIRMAYLAQNAEASAGQETPVGGAGQAPLEGAGARQQADEPSEEEAMLNAFARRTPAWGVDQAA